MPNEIGSQGLEKPKEEAKDKMKEVFEKKGVELGTDEFDVEKVSTQISDFDEKVLKLLNSGGAGTAESLKEKINSTPWAKKAVEDMKRDNQGKGIEVNYEDKKNIAEALVWAVWKYEFHVPFVVPSRRKDHPPEPNPTRVNDLYAKAQKECKSMADFNARFLTKMNFLQTVIA